MKAADLKNIIKHLDLYAPAFAVNTDRENILLELDKLFGEADSERSVTLRNFYRAQVDRVIAEVSAYNGKTPRFWKLYSSGFIIKDNSRVIGVDINDGCVPGFGRTALLLDKARLKKLSSIITEYYCTHSHQDHISPTLCDMLAGQGKLLVMPAEAIFRWSLKRAIAAENHSTSDVKCYLNWQGTAERGLDCAMYHFTLSNGKQIFIRGDIYHKEGFLGCIDFLEQNRLGVDYVFATHYFTSGPAPIPLLNEKYQCRFIPIHEWEFSHRHFHTPGPATQCFEELISVYAEPYQAGRAQFLTWGESIALD